MEGEILIRFSSPDFKEINSESISIPRSSNSDQLKALLFGLIDKKPESDDFDFLIGNQLLRAEIATHLNDNREVLIL